MLDRIVLHTSKVLLNLTAMDVWDREKVGLLLENENGLIMDCVVALTKDESGTMRVRQAVKLL